MSRSNRSSVARLLLCGAVLAIALAAFVALPSEAHAQDDEEARFHAVVGEAMRYYTEEKYDAAIERFFAAKLIKDKPELVYNIARAYDKMGRCSTAKKHYAQFLARGDSPDELRAKARSYDEALGECPTTGTLALTCSPADARVQIDGQTAAPCGQLTLEQGPHTLVVSAPGYVPIDRQVTIEAGETLATTIALNLEPSVAGGGGGSATVDSGGGFNWLGFSLVTAGAGLFIGAVVIDVVNQANIDELDRMPLGDPDRGSFEDALTTNQALMWTLGSIGIASLATGTVLWILGVGESSSSSAATSTDDALVDWQLTPAVGPQGAGASFRLDF